MGVGDYIDDYCSRCKLTTDHSVAAMAGDEPVKVICRTCNTEHKYRHNKGSKQLTAKEAFDKVFASVTGQLGGTAQTTPETKKSKSTKKKTS